jgi:hypothetical protein
VEDEFADQPGSKTKPVAGIAPVTSGVPLIRYGRARPGWRKAIRRWGVPILVASSMVAAGVQLAPYVVKREQLLRVQRTALHYVPQADTTVYRAANNVGSHTPPREWRQFVDLARLGGGDAFVQECQASNGTRRVVLVHATVRSLNRSTTHASFLFAEWLERRQR